MIGFGAQPFSSFEQLKILTNAVILLRIDFDLPLPDYHDPGRKGGDGPTIREVVRSARPGKRHADFNEVWINFHGPWLLLALADNVSSVAKAPSDDVQYRKGPSTQEASRHERFADNEVAETQGLPAPGS